MIRYSFTFDRDTTLEFEVADEILPVADQSTDLPPWVLLANHQCDDCPLPLEGHPVCPAAIAIRPVVEAFSKRISFEDVDVTVDLNGIEMKAHVSTQEAVRCLVGLLLARSACPILAKLRPMAHFHLPFGDRQHTSFRFLGMHLVAQYLRAREGLEPDWELTGFLDMLRRLRRLNARLADRIRAASELDAAVNSLVILDALASTTQLSAEKGLDRLRPIFSVYLDDD
jgi:hypothetical protein